MFNDLLNKVSANIATIRAIVHTNDRLRKIAFAQGSATVQESNNNAELTELIEGVPGESEWRVYEHCAVVTQLYAIYERFVEDLIADWLRLLPSIVVYSDLGVRIQNTHREGVGRLLLDLKKNRFEDLSIKDVVRGLFDGVAGSEYELFPDAFLFHEQNLRKDVLEKLFADAGISNAWTWVDKHRDVKQFVEELPGNRNTAERELKKLIEYRNEAAHGAVIEEFLASGALLKLGDFVEILCKALAELVTFQIILRRTSTGKAREIGQITEWFKKPKAAVAQVTNITLSVGKTLFIVSESSSYCCLATIRSLQINDVPQDEVEITSETEVGLQFDIDARKGFSIYAME